MQVCEIYPRGLVTTFGDNSGINKLIAIITDGLQESRLFARNGRDVEFFMRDKITESRSRKNVPLRKIGIGGCAHMLSAR